MHPWTFRAESAFLPAGLDLETELREFLAAGIDGFFTDQPDIGVRGERTAYRHERLREPTSVRGGAGAAASRVRARAEAARDSSGGGGGFHRVGQQVALHGNRPAVGEEFELRRALDAFGDHLQAEAVAERYD